MREHQVAGASEAVFGAQIGPTKLVNVHDPAACEGRGCCIHHPSDHHMVKWPQNWRDDRGLMERVCPHGIGHPDPDELAYKVSIGLRHEGVHGCDGCCRGPR